MALVTVKFQKFIQEPMKEKKVNDVPGIGPKIANNLEFRNIKTAKVLYQQFQEKGEHGFLYWLREVCLAKDKQSIMCVKAFKMWEKNFPYGNQLQVNCSAGPFTSGGYQQMHSANMAQPSTSQPTSQPSNNYIILQQLQQIQSNKMSQVSVKHKSNKGIRKKATTKCKAKMSRVTKNKLIKNVILLNQLLLSKI